MKIPGLNDIDVSGKRVLLRLDLNVPVRNGEVVDTFRIDKALPTIKRLWDSGARITIISHHSDRNQTLQPISRVLNNQIPTIFVEDIFAEDAFAEAKAAEAHTGASFVRLCENVRKWDEELVNDSSFARRLAELGDVFVNEAFSASHREHASIVGVPQLLPSCAGDVFLAEIETLSEAFRPEHPFAFVLGGAKPKTKVPIIKRFADTADTIFVGGAVAHSFYAALGYEIGTSRFTDIDMEDELRELVNTGVVQLPWSVIVKNPEGVFQRSIGEVESGDTILDIAPDAVERLNTLVSDARFIIWNGPLGDYLTPGFGRGTESFARFLAGTDARRIIGGGDTRAVLAENGLDDAFDFVSTGGGAMLMFLADGTLPGIEALKHATNG